MQAFDCDGLEAMLMLLRGNIYHPNAGINLKMLWIQHTVQCDPSVMNSSTFVRFWLLFFFLIIFENGSDPDLRVSAFGYVGN